MATFRTAITAAANIKMQQIIPTVFLIVIPHESKKNKYANIAEINDATDFEK